MLGTNPVEPYLRNHDGLTLDIKVVFPTIQGEGPYAGIPAAFIRVGGCHLACYFCDTDFTSDRRVTTVEQVLKACMVCMPASKLVVITGGEPMRQNVVPLCKALAEQGCRVQIETAGSFWVPQAYDNSFRTLIINNEVTLVVSPKTGFVVPQVAYYASIWKYIIGADTEIDPEDGLPLNSTQAKGRRSVLCRPPPEMMSTPAARARIYLQPCDVADAQAKEMAVQRCITLCFQYGYRYSMQQHKVLGMP
jgi:7-carboxy-7-deazaguanine synthase